MNTITDSHVHLWDPRVFHYEWLQELPALNRPFLLNDLDDATKGVPIDKLVFVQCDVRPEENLAEATWISSLAKTDQRIAAVVAGVRLEAGDAARKLLEEYKTM